MARITVEDCEKIIKNRFDLVVLASHRTRQIIAGDKITVDNVDNKSQVIALREIAGQTISIDALKESCVNSYRTVSNAEEDLLEEELLEEDTYNPYEGLALNAIAESEEISVISVDNIEDIEDIETIDNEDTDCILDE